MKTIKYFFEFLFIIILFFIFKIIGFNNASKFGSLLGKNIGPIFRSKEIITKNINNAYKNISSKEMNSISKIMWSNIGSTFAEYMYLNKLNKNHNNIINIEGLEYLKKINFEKQPVVFISGHFANFEIMAMKLHQQNIKLAAIFRPLNNFFLNPMMEYLRKKYICPVQIKKGKAGVKEMLKKYKEGFSIALMIDQRVSEGIKVNFFEKPALTTTIPAQLVLRFNCKIVPIYCERIDNVKFKITINQPLEFDNLENNSQNIEYITLKLNNILEKMIKQNPGQWIWSHNRWRQ